MNSNLIAPHLRTSRKLKGWNQDLLSAKLREAGYPVTRSMIANWEVQRSIVSDTYVFALATLFEVPVCALFQLPGEQRPEVNPIVKKK
ncbi:MAG: helix-turn-helix domain-containing protein [Verrucomicrobiales bacterium]|nr:helix-turn-helix domain-containing protein [Verrucomicrobiales bacterium]